MKKGNGALEFLIYFYFLDLNCFITHYSQRQGCNARKVNCSCVHCVHIKTSSFWAELTIIDASLFVYYPRGLKALYFDNFDNFDNSLNIFLWPEYFIDYLYERWIPWQASTSVLCLHYRPQTVHCSTKDAYTSEISFLALHPWPGAYAGLVMTHSNQGRMQEFF